MSYPQSSQESEYQAMLRARAAQVQAETKGWYDQWVRNPFNKLFAKTPTATLGIYFFIFLTGLFASIAFGLMIPIKTCDNPNATDSQSAAEVLAENTKRYFTYVFGFSIGIIFFGLIIWNTSLSTVLITMALIITIAIIVGKAVSKPESQNNDYYIRLHIGLLGFLSSVFISSIFSLIVNEFSKTEKFEKLGSTSILMSIVMGIIVIGVVGGFAIHQYLMIKRSDCSNTKMLNVSLISLLVPLVLLLGALGYGVFKAAKPGITVGQPTQSIPGLSSSQTFPSSYSQGYPPSQGYQSSSSQSYRRWD